MKFKRLKFSKIYAIPGIFFLMMTLVAHAQNPHPTFRQYAVENGLPSSEIYQVKQDSKGYIWFATGNGVSRFNGYEFENMSMADGLPDNTVFEIFEDSRGMIWFVPLSCKLSFYHEGKIHLYPYNDKIQQQVFNLVKTSFYVGDDGTVYIGLARNGVYEISPTGILTKYMQGTEKQLNLDIYEPQPSHFIHTYYKNSSGRARFNTSSIQGTMIFPLMDNDLLSVSRIIRLRTGEIVISYGSSLIIIRGRDDYDIHLFPSRINTSYEDNDGNLWVGTLMGGVYYIRDGDFANKKCYLKEHTINSILQDNEGGYWFGTEGDYVYYTPSHKIQTLDKASGFIDERLSCLVAEGNNLYVGTRGGYVYYLPEEGKMATFNITDNNEILNMFYDDETKRMFISHGENPNTKKHKHFFEYCFFYRVIKHRQSHWMSYTNGVFEYKKGLSPILNKRVNGLVRRGSDNVWFGAVDGLWDFNLDNHQLDYWGNKHPLLKSRIMDLAYSRDSLLVIATKGAGVLIYDLENVLQINTQKGLSDDNTYELFIEDSVIWVATNNGLNKITYFPSNYPKYNVVSYTIADGLASNEIQDVLCLNDTIWVATNKGLSFFHPDDIKKKSNDIPILIDKIKINDRDTVIQTEYRLKYNQNNIMIGFVGLGYRQAGKLHYRYKMDGLENRWNYTQNKEIQFTTLPGGGYTFMVCVQQADGNWGKPVQIRFVVTTPFWKQWPYQLSALLILLVLVTGLVQYRYIIDQREKEKINALNNNLLDLKLKALRAQMNPHFIFNVMNSIQHFILNKNEISVHRYISKFSRLIRAILNNSETNAVSIAEEIKALKLYLELETMRFEDKFKSNIIIDTEIDENLLMIPSMLLQPYVENSLLHGILPLTDKEGIITIEIRKDENHLRCIITDNGIGRVKANENKKDKSHKSFGTSITQERLSTLYALQQQFMSETVTDLYDMAGKPIGTQVIIYIPLITNQADESNNN